MKYRILILSFCWLQIGYSQNLLSVLEFASIEQGQRLITTEDEFTDCWSQFDIDSRMKKPESTKTELLNFAAQQIKAFSEKEKELVRETVSLFDMEVARLKISLPLPNSIIFVKSTTEEESGAGGYTRANYIVIKDELLQGDVEHLKHFVAHEVFHVISRNDEEFRRKMYGVINFSIGDNVEYPPSLRDLRMTNPDAIQTDAFVAISEGTSSVNYLMILYSKRPYDGGSFFNYLNVGFLKLDNDGREYVMQNGQPVVKSLREISGFHDMVGKNTGYIIHPEEIMADNFSFAIFGKDEIPSPWVIKDLLIALRE